MWAIRRSIQPSKILLCKNTFPQMKMINHARSSANATAPLLQKPQSTYQKILSSIKANPIEFATIPAVAALVGISTNYMGVQMLFYPLEYRGSSFKRYDKAPYGIFGWQGVVPARTEKMALRLVDIVTRDLLSLKEAFGHLDAKIFANLMTESVVDAVREECGGYWAMVLKPFLPMILTRVVGELQKEIDNVLDLPDVVLNAFVRDKIVLVELFQKVGRVELKFLIESGFGFGFLLGLGQMALWAVRPQPWTLPVAGALVGYVTNYVAIKLLFEPAEPVDLGPVIVQGLFESRQKEVSEEFAYFMENRVLSSPMLLGALANQNEQELFEFLRKHLPYPIPEKILRAAIQAIRNVASDPEKYDQLHSYVQKKLDIEETLSKRLKKLSAKNFEDLLHPVFQEDEIILIVVGGVLGAVAGVLQTRVVFSGSNARMKGIVVLATSLIASASFFLLSEYSDYQSSDAFAKAGYDPVIDREPSKLRRTNTVLRREKED